MEFSSLYRDLNPIRDFITFLGPLTLFTIVDDSNYHRGLV